MRLSVQLYTLRDDLAADLRGTLERVRGIGLEYVELAGLYGKSPEEWRDLLGELGLKASGSHVGLEAFETDEAAALAEAKLFGDPFVIVPYVSADGFKAQAAELKERMRKVSGALKANGMSLLYHNHDHEMEMQNGRTLLEDLFDGLDPQAVGAELDVAWVKIGGQDPVAYMRTLGPYLRLLHLKDFSGSGEGRKWVPAGQGEVDFDAVLPLARELGIEYGAIELDNSPDMPAIEAVAQSYEFFKSKGLS